MKFKFFFLGFITSIFLLAFALGSFLMGKFSASVKDEPEPTSIPEISLSKPATPTPKPDIKAEIEAAVESGQYHKLVPFMTNVVNIRIEASECCQPNDRANAVDQLKYLDSAKAPWDFDQNSTIAKDLAASYPEHYANAIIGISTNNYLVAFQLNDDGAIEKVSMASNYKLLLVSP